MGKMKDLKIEIEEGVYELENMESELAWIKDEMKILENRRSAIEKEIEALRTRFGPYHKVFSQKREVSRR